MDTTQTPLLALNLGSKVWIYREKKRWTGLFKVLGIAKAGIIVDIRNSSITFWNMHVKPYYYHIEETDISYPEIINNLVEKPEDKSANKGISIPLDYLKLQRPHW